MLGTGEFASSASESTVPSGTSSAWGSGTYCRQIGSPGDLMRSTMAGEMRNSKSSAARRSRSRSGKCSGPKRATSASSDAMLRLRSSSCQDSIRQVVAVDHPIVAGCVVPRESRRRPIPSPLVEATCRDVLGAGRRLDDDQAAPSGQQLPFDGGEELGPDALPLPRGLDDDPVQVVRAARARRRTPAGVASELVARVAAQEAVVVVAGEALVEQLHGDRDLFRLEHAGGAGEDRKSTRLNSSHRTISYAVFCLKKKQMTWNIRGAPAASG